MWQLWKPSHLCKDCLSTSKRGKGNDKLPPGDCPHCGKGRHWAKECCSKFDKNCLPISGKLLRAHLLQHPQTQLELSEQQSSSGNSRKCTISDLHAATCRSAGLDLVTTKELILKEQDQVIIAPIGVWGPLPPGMVGLILGRSSTTTKGIFVQPGVIDSDYQKEIKIMLKASGYHIIPTHTHIAQLLLLPYVILKTQNTVWGKESSAAQTINHFLGQNPLS